MPPRPEESEDRGNDREPEEPCRQAGKLRFQAEICARPDSEDLERRERSEEVAELVRRREREPVVPAEELRGRDQRGEPEGEGQRGCGDASSRSPEEQDPGCRQQPQSRTYARSEHERRCRHCGHEGRSDSLARPEERRGDERDRGSGVQLLHPSPLCESVQESGLRRDSSHESVHPGTPPDAACEDVEHECEHRGEKGQIRLQEPCRVRADQPGAYSERQKRPGRIAVSQVDGERRLVRGRGEPVQVTSVLEGPIGQSEKGRAVVELDVAREGRFSRGDHGCAHREKRGERPGSRAPVETGERSPPV